VRLKKLGWMAAKVDVKPKVVKTILVSQPQPTIRSPYYELEEKYGVKVDFRPFIHVEGISAKDFRKQRIRIEDFTSIVLTSKNAVDHFFRLCEEIRYKMPQGTKYFCTSEAIALYLQKFIVYRKRKVFFGQRTLADLSPYLTKHKKKEKFLIPCSDLGNVDFEEYMAKNEFDFSIAHMYKTVSSDLSDLSDITYDMLVFFSPLGIKSLYENFPDFKQNETRLAVYGSKTWQAVEERGLDINIQAPNEVTTSMTTAISHYLKLSNEG
jgi:uroporphyrinogen-III synthase